MKNKIYFLIPLYQVFLVIFASYFYITETNDSRSYYAIATNLPKLSNSLFPILYPSFLKFFYFFWGDFFVASKLINISCILLFFLLTNMYVKEWKLIWLFSLSWFFTSIFIYSWSEILLIPLFTILFILQRKYWNNEINNPLVVTFSNSTVLFFLFLAKYSMLYIIIGTLFFGILMYLYTKNKKHLLFIYSSFISSFLCGIYLYINYIATGYFTGNREALGEITTNIRLSLYNTLQTANPFWGNLLGRSPYILVIFIFVVLTVIYFKRILKIWKDEKIENLYFIFISLIYLFLLWISYFNTKIDVLGIRLLFPFCFLFFIGIIANNIKIKYFYKYLIIIISILQIFISFNRTNQYF